MPWAEVLWHDCMVPALDEDGTLSFLRSWLVPGPGEARLERKLVGHKPGNPLSLGECLQVAKLVQPAEIAVGFDLARVGDGVGVAVADTGAGSVVKVVGGVEVGHEDIADAVCGVRVFRGVESLDEEAGAVGPVLHHTAGDPETLAFGEAVADGVDPQLQAFVAGGQAPVAGDENDGEGMAVIVGVETVGRVRGVLDDEDGQYAGEGGVGGLRGEAEAEGWHGWLWIDAVTYRCPDWARQPC